ncbi:hypothetical protein ARMGADRAFT_1029708 [Armillaria gallica]|uniref:Uncharacterized protein n=1 Tax=Armillaria gallica TaxID=47427 RepID=A0A2H3DF27_ARMGA|nr:hypothetical protein ARMGADRAFT_1029708 [Armillaria gallica]
MNPLDSCSTRSRKWQRRRRLDSVQELEASLDQSKEELAIARCDILYLMVGCLSLKRRLQNDACRAGVASQKFLDLIAQRRKDEEMFEALLEENSLLRLRVAELELEKCKYEGGWPLKVTTMILDKVQLNTRRIPIIPLETGYLVASKANEYRLGRQIQVHKRMGCDSRTDGADLSSCNTARCAKQIAVTEIRCLKATGREYTMWIPATLLRRERFVREWELRRPTLSHLVIQRRDCRKILIFFSSRRHFQRQSGICSYIIYTVFLLPRRDQASASKMEKVQTTESPASDGKAEVDQWLSLRYMRPHQYAQAQRGFPRKNSRRCLTGNHRAARAGKTQKVRQGDEGDDEFDLILATLCAQSFFTVKGEVFKSEEGDTVSDSLWFNDSEGTAAISAAWYMRRERLKTSLLAQLQELVKRARQLMNMGVDCRSAVDHAIMVTKQKYQASTLLNLPSACFIHGPAEFELAPMDSSRAVSANWRVQDSGYRLAANQGVPVTGVVSDYICIFQDIRLLVSNEDHARTREYTEDIMTFNELIEIQLEMGLGLEISLRKLSVILAGVPKMEGSGRSLDLQEIAPHQNTIKHLRHVGLASQGAKFSSPENTRPVTIDSG